MSIHVTRTRCKHPKLTITADNQIRVKIHEDMLPHFALRTAHTLRLTAEKFIAGNPDRKFTLRGEFTQARKSMRLRTSMSKGQRPQEVHIVEIVRCPE